MPPPIVFVLTLDNTNMSFLSIQRYEGIPLTSVGYPIFSGHGSKRRVVGVICGTINWAAYFENILPTNSPGVTLVLENGCINSAGFAGEDNNGIFSYAVS